RKVSGGGLGLEDRAAGSVHGDAVELSVDGGEQGNDLEIGLLMEEVERPRGIFAAAPGEDDALDSRFHEEMVPPICVRESCDKRRSRIFRQLCRRAASRSHWFRG